MIGGRIRAAREALNLSLEEEAAGRTGFSAGTLGDLERGVTKSPPLGTLLFLMRFFKLPSIELLLGPGPFPSGHLAALLPQKPEA
jgi:transcriptional regulator with XRE-family HTH domain